MKSLAIIAAVVALTIAATRARAADTAPATLLYLDQQGWTQASGETKAALAADFMRVFCGNPAMPPADLVGCLDRGGPAGSMFERAMACIATVPVAR